MNNSKLIPAKLFISLLVPLLMVTLGGLIVYQTPSAFFYSAVTQNTTESNGPAAIYYALTFAIALMFFLMRQKYKLYEFIALGLLSVIFSLALRKMTLPVYRPVYVYLVPLLIFFLLIWLILKFIFLNQSLRTFRLLLFSLFSSAAFTFAFWLQYILLRQLTENTFLQSRFFSGLMLFIFMGFGLSLAEFIISKLEEKASPKQPAEVIPPAEFNRTGDDEDN